MNTKLIITLSALLLICSGCTTLERLKRTDIKGGDFNSELAINYRNFSDSEARQYDWPDSGYFAKKGMLAAKGVETIPEDPNRWKLTPENRAELLAARDQLLLTLNQQNKTEFPRETAKTQSFYDCWVEQQEENWQIYDIAYCKGHFIDAMNYLYNVRKEKEVAIIIPVKHYHTVYFEFDKYQIDSTEESILREALVAISDLPDHTITISGYADNTGSDAYNDKLSFNRAETVKKYLTEAGIDSEIMDVKNFGKHYLAIETPYGIKERKNRRVEIYIHKK